MRVQDELVDRPLRAREGAADGPGARDVAGVAVQLAPRVHQHQLPVAHPLRDAAANARSLGKLCKGEHFAHCIFTRRLPRAPSLEHRHHAGSTQEHPGYLKPLRMECHGSLQRHKLAVGLLAGCSHHRAQLLCQAASTVAPQSRQHQHWQACMSRTLSFLR